MPRTVGSVIVPAGPGEDAWRGLVPSLETLGPDWEVILSAAEPGPSEPPAGVRWITGPAGRAGQLNRGIRAAAGGWLWLLHADCRPDDRALEIASDLARPDPTGGNIRPGYFRLRFAADGPALTRLNGHGGNLRARLFAQPFGDQGWLLPRALVERLGGFDESLDRGEDLDFAVRARAAGYPFRPLAGTVTASARRYRQHGWLRTTAEHARLTWQLTRASRRRIREART